MFKALVLTIASVATVSAFINENVQTRMMNQYSSAVLDMEDIIVTHNLRGVGRDSSLDQHKEMRLEARTAPNNDAWTTIDWTDTAGCAHGFTYGLQFSTAKKGACYNSIDSSIDAVKAFVDLMPTFYMPG